MTALFVGLAFFIIGIIACFYYKWKKPKAYIPLIIGAVLIILSTIGPLSKANAEVVKVTNIASSHVTAIILEPTERKGVKSIVQQSVVITDTTTIRAICTALNQAQVQDENYMKNFAAAGKLKFNMKDNSNFSIGLKIYGQATRIDINSNGESGWHYKVLSADHLSSILEQVD